MSSSYQILEQNAPKPSEPSSYFITQKLDFLKAGKEVQTPVTELDGKSSCIYGTSVFALIKKGQDIATKKNSDDKIVIGYSHQGLPFQIVVDGFFGKDEDDRALLFHFIDTRVTPLISIYVDKLTKGNESLEMITSLVRDIFKERKQNASPDFTMSIAITYEKKNAKLYCAGFGIGDTGIVLKKANGQIQQLVDTTIVKEQKEIKENEKFIKDKDGFGGATVNLDLTQILNRNSIFNVEVEPNDEIFGYTYLLDDLLVEVETKEEDVIKKQLRVEANKSEKLFDQVKRLNAEIFQKKTKDAIEAKRDLQLGDDCMMGSVLIPDKQLQDKLIKKFSLNTYYDLEKYEMQFYLRHAKNTLLYSNILNIYERITALEKNAIETDQIVSTRQLAVCNKVLFAPNEMNINNLLNYANDLEGKPSLAFKALGAAMMLLGAALVTLSTLVIVGSLPVIPIGVLTAAAIALGGVALFSTGVGFFATGCRRGLSKEMTQLANTAESCRARL